MDGAAEREPESPGRGKIRLDSAHSLRVRPRAYAALDLGTNNCRLLIARPQLRGFRVIDAFSRIVRLGEGLAHTGALAEPAMRRTIDALKICRDKMSSRRVTRARLVTTEACRAAVNGNHFLSRVESETGLAFEVLDQAEEAALAAAGCEELADPAASGVILFDIGGGSTEIVWLTSGGGARAGIRDRIRAWISLPVGVVTMAERHGGGEVSDVLYERMVAEAALHLAPFAVAARGASETPGFHLLGTSGTVTTIAGLHLGLSRYERRLVDGLWMRRHEVDIVLNKLCRMNHRERAANGCIGAERADLVLAGCAIFDAIRRAFPADRLRIADRGLREGMLTAMMDADGVWHGGAAQ